MKIRLTLRTTVLTIGRALLLAEFAYFVLSNTEGLHDVLPVTLKHALFVALALLSLICWPGKSIKTIVLAAPIAAIYFVGEAWVFGIMVLVLALCMPLVSRIVVDVIANKRKWVIWLLFVITLLPLIINSPSIAANGIFDMTYGRPRALLGYWHPKDGGVAFGVPALMLIIMLERRVWTLAFAASAFIWMVGSRNVALVMLTAAAMRRYPKAFLIGIAATLVALTSWLILDPDLYDILDTLLSLRLSVWQDALADNGLTRGIDVLDGDRFAVDNFFVEGFIYAGPLALALAGVWLATAIRVAQLTPTIASWPSVAIVLLVTFASFDSGIASTGNLMHVLLWSIILSPLVLGPKQARQLARQHRLNQGSSSAPCRLGAEIADPVPLNRTVR